MKITESESIWGRILRNILRTNKIGFVGTLTAIAVIKIGLLAYLLVVFGSDWPSDPHQTFGKGKLAPPDAEYLLGSDHLGRSIAARLFRGTATSFVVTGLTFSLCLITGIIIGITAGRAKGWLSTIFDWVQEAFECFPRLLLVITLLMLMGFHLIPAAIAIGLVLSGSAVARLREEMEDHDQRGYILAAKVMGTSPVKTFFRHSLTNLFPPILITSLLLIPDAIFLEAACGYIGISAQSPFISLGDLAGEGRSFLLDAPWIILFPGLAIMLSVLSFHLMGKAFERALREVGQR